MTPSSASDLKVELDLLRDEAVSMRQEVERRDRVAREIEEQQQAEQTSLRKSIRLLEDQLEWEKQVRPANSFLPCRLGFDRLVPRSPCKS